MQIESPQLEQLIPTKYFELNTNEHVDLDAGQYELSELVFDLQPTEATDNTIENKSSNSILDLKYNLKLQKERNKQEAIRWYQDIKDFKRLKRESVQIKKEMKQLNRFRLLSRYWRKACSTRTKKMLK